MEVDLSHAKFITSFESSELAQNRDELSWDQILRKLDIEKSPPYGHPIRFPKRTIDPKSLKEMLSPEYQELKLKEIEKLKLLCETDANSDIKIKNKNKKCIALLLIIPPHQKFHLTFGEKEYHNTGDLWKLFIIPKKCMAILCYFIPSINNSFMLNSRNKKLHKVPWPPCRNNEL